MTRRAVYLLMAVHVAGSAVTYVLGKHAAVGFPDAGSLALARALGAGLLLLALTGWAIPVPRFTPRDWAKVAALSVLLVPMNQYLFLRGLRDTVPGHPPLFYATTPAGVLVLQSVLVRRAPPALRTLGVVLALAGVVVVLRPWEKDDPRFAAIRTGDLYIAAGTLVWIVYTVAATPLFRAHDPRTVTAWMLALGAAFLAPVAGGDLATMDFAAVPADAWWGLAWLAGGTSAGMMLMWNGMLRHLDPVQVAVSSNLQPAATAALAAALAHVGWMHEDQDLGPLYWIGTALVLVGVLLVQRPAAARLPR